MNIQLGKQYKTRIGHKVTIYRTDAKGSYSVHGCSHYENEDTVMSWTSTGKFLRACDIHLQDIISEWSEPVTFDWRQVPLCCQYVAMDQSGEWFAYKDEPRVIFSVWNFDRYHIRIHPDHYPKNFTGDWKDSLMQRPSV